MNKWTKHLHNLVFEYENHEYFADVKVECSADPTTNSIWGFGVNYVDIEEIRDINNIPLKDFEITEKMREAVYDKVDDMDRWKLENEEDM